MQNIIVEEPYRFIKPLRSSFWSSCFYWFGLHNFLLRRTEGVVSHELRHIERLHASLAAGHAVMVTPNHPRTADPLAVAHIAVAAPCHFYAMTSWHLFARSKLQSWIMWAMGSFSINREGVDRQAINAAIELLAEGRRPMLIFPEGSTSRTADCLQALLDGVAFIARAAAKKRAKHTPPGKVVIHPVAFKYLYGGDIRQAADSVLTSIEHRLTWQPQRHRALVERMIKVGSALLSLKEIEYLGQPQPGRIAERLANLIDRLLGPIEAEWFRETQTGPVVARVRSLRTRILPDMVAGRVTPEERTRRWQHLADIYLAQQLSTYPPGYLERPTVDRVLEILEKFEEDITDKARLHKPLKVIIEIGEAIEVSPERDRRAAVDPLLTQIRDSLQSMIDRLSTESPLLTDS